MQKDPFLWNPDNKDRNVYLGLYWGLLCTETPCLPLRFACCFATRLFSKGHSSELEVGD